MEIKDFREFGKQIIDYIADYYETIRDRKVLPDVERGYLHKLLPKEAPTQPDHWTQILPDVDAYIMPGLTHWQSPNFNGYFPSNPSLASILGELLTAGCYSLPITWKSSPAGTELEVICMDWLGKLIGLPEQFLNCTSGPGGGVIQQSASEATLMCLLAARESVVKEIKSTTPMDEVSIRSKLVSYTSDQANIIIERAARIASVTMRILPSNKQGGLPSCTLQQAVHNDLKEGLIPFFVCATLGSTASCAFDNLLEIGSVCRSESVWLHVDAAYAGAAFICPEFRNPLQGIEYVDSFLINPHKWFMVNFGCTALWLRDSIKLKSSLHMKATYLQCGNDYNNNMAPDYRHWMLSLGKKNQSLKLWMTLRLHGKVGLQKHIRRQCNLAKRMAKYIENDDRFYLHSTILGVVLFNLKGPTDFSMKLLNEILESKEMFMVPGTRNGKSFLRYVVNSWQTTEEDIDKAWEIIIKYVDKILIEN